MLFVDGNHEQFAHWETRPFEMWRGGLTQRLSEDSPIRRLCRGELFELGGSRVFVLGGAASTDWYFGHFHRDRDLDDAHTVLYNEVVRLGDGVFG